MTDAEIGTTGAVATTTMFSLVSATWLRQNKPTLSSWRTSAGAMGEQEKHYACLLS